MLLKQLKFQKEKDIKEDVFEDTQILFAYHSGKLAGFKLEKKHVRYLFRTKRAADLMIDFPIDHLMETINHFECMNYVISYADVTLNEEFILKLHYLLKEDSEDTLDYGCGVYKDEIGTSKAIQELLVWYNKIDKPTFEDIVEFHYRFEIIKPFRNGNGRIGRLVAFKECLKNKIVPFYIDYHYQDLYDLGFNKWKEDKSFLISVCKFGQTQYKQVLDARKKSIVKKKTERLFSLFFILQIFLIL